MKTKGREGELLALKNLLAGEMAERKALEKMLRASSTRFDEFFYLAPVGLALLDNELRYVSVNDALARSNGLPAEQHKGKSVAEVIPALAPLVEIAIRRVLQTGEPVLNLEVSGERAGRAGRWLISFVPLDAAGEGGVGAVVLDVTDRAPLDEALALPAAGLASIFKHSWDAIFFFGEDGHILDANPRAERLLGYTREELLGLRWHDLIPARDLEESPVRLEELRAGVVVRSQRRLRRKDGSLVEVEAVGSAVGGGVVLSFVRERTESEARGGDRPASAIQLGRLIGGGSVGAGLGFLKELTAALTAATEFLEQSRGDDAAEAVDVSHGVEFYEEVSRFETNLISRALRQTGGNQKRAAELLGMRPNTLSAMIHRHGINADEFKA
jgi:PAS domain S-box-containing protein